MYRKLAKILRIFFTNLLFIAKIQMVYSNLLWRYNKWLLFFYSYRIHTVIILLAIYATVNINQTVKCETT